MSPASRYVTWQGSMPWSTLTVATGRLLLPAQTISLPVVLVT
jgi:hypothetical protein